MTQSVFEPDFTTHADVAPVVIVPPYDSPSERPPSRRAENLVPVLHVINGEHYSGAERVQDLLAQRLDEFGYAVGFACLKTGRFADERRSQSAPLHQFSMRSRVDLWPALALARLVRSHGYRLIHTHTPRAALVGRLAAALSRVPLVHHLHSPTEVDSTHRLRNQFNASVEQWGFRRASAVIAVSDSLAEYGGRQGISPRRLSVVPNGVPTPDRLATRRTPAGHWTLGCVALFRPRKGLEVLLDSLALLRRQGRDVVLRAVGAFETEAYRQAIHDQVARLELEPFVTWSGFSSDVPAELAGMDLFVLPSLFGEGMPMVILEAMAAGVPVVATRVEGVPQVIRNNMEGLLSKPGDPHDLAWQISRVHDAEIDWQALRLAAYSRQREHFSDRSMARATAEVYQRLGVR